MFNFFTENPGVGIVSGFGSGVLLSVQTFIADEHVLKLISVLGIWGGAAVALLTLILKAIEFGEKMNKKFGKK